MLKLIALLVAIVVCVNSYAFVSYGFQNQQCKGSPSNATFVVVNKCFNGAQDSTSKDRSWKYQLNVLKFTYLGYADADCKGKAQTVVPTDAKLFCRNGTFNALAGALKYKTGSNDQVVESIANGDKNCKGPVDFGYISYGFGQVTPSCSPYSNKMLNVRSGEGYKLPA